MKDRIRKLMEAQHMNQQTFAQMTGIGAASLSSIFNGRTEPTLRHVEAIRKKFPNINLQWLLSGEGGMFVPASGSDDNASKSPDLSASPSNAGTDILADGMLDFSADDADFSSSPSAFSSPSAAPSRQTSRQYSGTAHPSNPSRQQSVAMHVPASRRITEIRVFYDDQTWESFVPKK